MQRFFVAGTFGVFVDVNGGKEEAEQAVDESLTLHGGHLYGGGIARFTDFDISIKDVDEGPPQPEEA